MADGIIQWIKLKLDKNSVKVLEQEAKEATARSASNILKALESGNEHEKSVGTFVRKIREALDKQLGLIKTQLSQGLGDPNVAKAAADRMVTEFNARLKSGIEKIGKGNLQPGLLKEIGTAFKQQSLGMGDLMDQSVMFGRSMGGPAEGFLNNLRTQVTGTFARIHRDWLQVWDIPPQAQVTPKLDKQLRKEAKGDIEEYQRLLQAAKLAQQATTATLTPLGKAFQGLGANVQAVSPAMRGLLTNMYQLQGNTQALNALNNQSMFSWGSLTSTVGKFAAQLGIVIGAQKAVQFGMSSVKEFAEQEAHWARLSTSLADYGVRLSTIRPHIDALIADNIRLGYSSEKTLSIFGTLVQLTGDYQKSLRAVPVVLDIMVARHMTLEMAAKSVGRAIVGSTESLQRQGIYLDQNIDAIDQLSARFSGEALARSKTFAGSLDRMAASWRQLKLAMGEALIEGGGGVSFMDTLIEGLKEAVTWIRENQEAIQAFGLAVRTVIMAAVTLINGFATGIKIGVIVIETLIGAMRNVAPAFKLGWANAMEYTAIAFRWIAKAADLLFGTQIAKQFDALILKAKQFQREAKNTLETNAALNAQVVMETWNGTPTRPGSKGTPDQPLGDADKPRAQYHMKLSREIINLRKSALLDDIDDSNKAVGRLNELMAEMKEKAEAVTDNYKEQAEYNAHIFQIQQALAAVDKKRSDEARLRKEEAALNRRIELNAQLLLSENAKFQKDAAVELNAIEEELLRKQKTHKLSKEEQLTLTHHLLQIEEARERLTKDIETKENKEIDRLKSMVKLNVNREEAQKELNRLYAKYTGELQAAQAKGDLVAAERAAKHLADVEQAAKIEYDLIDERVKRLAQELTVAETRKKALQDLFTLQHQLENRLTNKTVLERDKADIINLINQIKGVVGEPVDVKKMRQQVNALTDLTKHARTAIEALHKLEELQGKLEGLLAGGQPLTDEDEAVVKDMVAKIQAILRHHPLSPEPFLKQLKDTMQDELPAIAEATAQGMADSFANAFQAMIRDARNVNKVLREVPKGIALAFAVELRNIAMNKAKENFAMAIESTGYGLKDLFTPGMQAKAAGEFAAAAQFAAAGAAWSLLGGVAGAVGQSAGGPAATGYGGGSQSGLDKQGGNGPIIYLSIDGVDPNNPNHQRLMGETIRQYRERYGGNVVVTGNQR